MNIIDQISSYSKSNDRLNKTDIKDLLLLLYNNLSLMSGDLEDGDIIKFSDDRLVGSSIKEESGEVVFDKSLRTLPGSLEVGRYQKLSGGNYILNFSNSNHSLTSYLLHSEYTDSGSEELSYYKLASKTTTNEQLLEDTSSDTISFIYSDDQTGLLCETIIKANSDFDNATLTIRKDDSDGEILLIQDGISGIADQETSIIYSNPIFIKGGDVNYYELTGGDLKGSVISGSFLPFFRNKGHLSTNVVIITEENIDDYLPDLTTNVHWLAPIKDRDLTSPPSNPEDRDRYILGSTREGAWSSFSENDIVEYDEDDSSWDNTAPMNGDTLYVKDEHIHINFNGTEWIDIDDDTDIYIDTITSSSISTGIRITFEREGGVDDINLDLPLASSTSNGIMSSSHYDKVEQVSVNPDWDDIENKPTIIPDAPSDGNIYGRQNGGWTTIENIDVLWAEENASLNTGTNDGYQFSYGNGATKTNLGIVIPKDGVLIGGFIRTQNNTTGTVRIYVNTTNTGIELSLSSSSSFIKTDASYDVSEGDLIKFRTTSGSGGSGVTVGAYIKYPSSSGGIQLTASEIRNKLQNDLSGDSRLNTNALRTGSQSTSNDYSVTDSDANSLIAVNNNINISSSALNEGDKLYLYNPNDEEKTINVISGDISGFGDSYKLGPHIGDTIIKLSGTNNWASLTRLQNINDVFKIKDISDNLSWDLPSVVFVTDDADLTFNLGDPANAPFENRYNMVSLYNLGGLLSSDNDDHDVIVNLPDNHYFNEGISSFKVKVGEKIDCAAFKNINGSTVSKWAVITPLKMCAYGKNTSSYTVDTEKANLTLSYNDSSELFNLNADGNELHFGKNLKCKITVTVRFKWTGSTTTGSFAPQIKLMKNNTTSLYTGGGVSIEKVNGYQDIIGIFDLYDEFLITDFVNISLANFEIGVEAGAVRISVETII